MDNPATNGVLYLIPTPIGNLEDITDRARKLLQSVAVIACEDSRVTGQLLKRLEVRAKLVSYHDYNEAQRALMLLTFLKTGQDVAVVTDAGSPGISDPAYRIINAAIDEGIQISALPGPTAIVPALTASGLPTDRFFFEGFAPRTTATRKKRFRELADFPHTLIFLESPARIASTIRDALDVFGERRACIAREISKLHEEFLRGSLAELHTALQERKLKGEIVLVVGGKEKVKRVKKNKYRP
jgi:16S rRNA (cytidine1402-2'-O)-methyltransferase